MNKKEILEYWVKSADIDYKTMQYLYKGKEYTWSLFIGHIVVEKLLKAYYVQNIEVNTPHIHDLLRIAEKANLHLSEEQKDFLDTLTSFNIKTRYDDYKLKFHRMCTREFAEEYITNIRKFRTWIKRKL